MRNSAALITVLLCLALTGSLVTASGFEKGIPWGGETSGVGGIATPYIQGSQALFFNPAGLVSDKQQQDISLNLSPAGAIYKGPIYDSNTQETSNQVFSVPFALMYGNTVNDSVGFGAGVYAAGGTQVEYTGLTFPGINGTQDLKSSLQIIEFAAGLGFKLTDRLKIGAAWRAVWVQGSLTSIKVVGATVQNVELDGLSDVNYMGGKFGAQYKLTDNTDFGIAYRSEVGFHAKGTMSGTVYTAGPSIAIPQNDVTVGSVFPQALTVGLMHRFDNGVKVMGEYVWTQYSKVTNLAIDPAGKAGTPQELQWYDQYNVRFGTEIPIGDVPLRFGYVFTSRVVNPDWSNATMTPPGIGHTGTLGVGVYSSPHMKLDLGAEVGYVSGNGTDQIAKNEVTSYALHLGSIFIF